MKVPKCRHAPVLPRAIKVKKAHARRDVHIGGHEHKEDIDEMRFCSVLDSNGANTYRVTGKTKQPFIIQSLDLGN